VAPIHLEEKDPGKNLALLLARLLLFGKMHLDLVPNNPLRVSEGQCDVEFDVGVVLRVPHLLISKDTTMHHLLLSDVLQVL
jgi:hypothetical protein